MTFKPIKSALDTLNVYPDGWENEPVTIEPNEPAPVEIQYERKWVALLTMPSQEHKAQRFLTKISAMTPTVVYWPHVVTQTHVRGRRQLVDRPRTIFSGLLFASIALGRIRGYDPFREVESTPGVRGYLRNGRGIPVYVSDKDMWEIERIEIEQNCPPEMHDKCPPKAEELRVGQPVRVMVDLVNEWRKGTIAKRFADGSYEIAVSGFLGRVTTMRLFANQVEAV